MTTRKPIRLVVESEYSPDYVRFLEDRLYEFNVAATGIADGRLLAITVRRGRRDPCRAVRSYMGRLL